MLVLGLETSCDETGLALYDTARGLQKCPWAYGLDTGNNYYSLETRSITKYLFIAKHSLLCLICLSLSLFFQGACTEESLQRCYCQNRN
ncbi:MAG: hypothetical protein B7Z23_02680 [Pseudomonadales bacterium 32-61-5]|nr:MAG: hypothetical protein B7Z23_02680 [Pseudomonadales bacterium 32-61-5]